MSTMSYGGSTKHSGSPGSRRSMDGDTTEDGGDDRDETKRRSRNLSEKKRRDQFNVLINELCSMVSTSPRKMDKSTVLKATIAFLKAHNGKDLSVQSQVQETQEDWKPSFLSNEEFTHLMLEALDGFIIVISSAGKILYLSESITSLLGYLSTDLVSGNSTIYDFILPEERNDLYGILSNSAEDKYKGQVSMVLNFRVGGLETSEENQNYQLVKLIGYFKRWISPDCGTKTSSSDKTGAMGESSSKISGHGYVLIATGRLIICDLLREMSVLVDSEKNEFASRHSLEWKFLFLDHRAPPIIGYLPFEVLGTSGYDYYHVEDVEKVATCHEALMQRGEGTSCYYRFLTKGQQWIWLQTRFYITYHQWNSKPEFIVCTHRVVSYADVMRELRGETPASSTFDDLPSLPRLGPTGPKQFKMESSSKGHSSLKSSSRHKNGSLSYGSVGSKRNSSKRKLELPPKFASDLSASHSHPILVHPETQLLPMEPPRSVVVPISIENSLSSSMGMNIVCTKPLSTPVAVALHTQVSQHAPPPPHQAVLSPPAQMPIGTPTAVALPVGTYYNSIPQNPTFAITNAGPIQTPGPPPGIPISSQGIPIPPQSVAVSHPMITSPLPPSILQDQLLKKHAELQRQIIQQQEELRRVSEKLLMAQCGWIPGDSVLLPQPPTHGHPMHPHPPEDNSTIQLQPIQCQPSPSMMAYSSHPQHPQHQQQLPSGPAPSQAPPSNNPEGGGGLT